ncbi:hypothetical protein D3C73_1431650 [compost metagenome]
MRCEVKDDQQVSLLSSSACTALYTDDRSFRGTRRNTNVHILPCDLYPDVTTLVGLLQ